MKYRLLCGVLVSILCLSGGLSAVAADRELIVGLAGDAYSLNPYPRNETITNAINNHIFDSLIGSDNDLQPIPALAERWETSEDASVWTFFLRKGVKFHNGNDFTVDDVLYSFDKVKIRETSAFSFTLSTVESYKKLDDHTFEVTCKAPNSLLLAHLREISILDKESCDGQTEDWIALHPNGTGRYKLVEHVREDRIVLERNEAFWGDLPEPVKVVFKPISNDGTRTANMLSGAVDMIVNVPVRDVEMLRKRENIAVVTQPSLRIIYLNMQGWTDSPSPDAAKPLKSPDGSNPLKKLEVRQAMYHAINEDEIVSKIMNNLATPTATYIPAGFNGYNPDIKRLPYDPVLAEQLLDKAGYPRQADGYRFELTLDSSNDRYVNDGDIATAVAGYLERVGIKTNLNLMSRTIFFTYIGTKNTEGDTSHLCMTGWADSGGESALMALDLMYSIRQDGEVKPGYGGVNRSFYLNPKVDALIDKAISTPDPAERSKIMQEVWQIGADDVVYIPLHFQEDIYAANKDKIIYRPRKNNYIYAWDFEFVK
ncbi:MAG: ABC transporter substrate-binding protein [Synergistaceae bacterium]|jgi:peptide/nickel transport system substrate-binding protein|nr:ABC transporter substrate-binding protein [Synergistaceae bacterium]